MKLQSDCAVKNFSHLNAKKRGAMSSTTLYIGQDTTSRSIYFTGFPEANKAFKAIALYTKEEAPTIFASLRTKAKQVSEEILSAASSIKRLSKEDLALESIRIGESTQTNNGVLATMTGKYTGRTPEAKFFEETDATRRIIDWSENAGLSKGNTSKIYEDLKEYLKGKPLYVHDCQVGVGDTAIPLRVINESPAQNFFAQNMFIKAEKPHTDPKVTLISAPGLKLDPIKHGVKCEAGVIINPDDGVIMVAGTGYAGETKKSVFSLVNYLAPQKDILPMHCSANVSKEGDVNLFFGLSGTGKTTLSADIERMLIGDDEHLWTNKGIVNIEGGCYAKTIGLSKQNEPDIFKAVNMKGAMLENVHVDKYGNPLFDLNLENPNLIESLEDPNFVKQLNLPDELLKVINKGELKEALKDKSFRKDLQAALKSNEVENSRGSYPLNHISNAIIPGKFDAHPKNIIFLAYDAFGVLPPVSKLTPEQAKYYFISGYTSKVAGTERGITSPKTTFSPCFGGPFMSLHPFEYAKLLEKKIKEHGSDIYIVNTGLVGGKHGVGSRISIKDTRGVVDAVLSGKLKDIEYINDPIFGFMIPKTCPGVDSKILNPATSWSNKEEYHATANELAQSFITNFNKKYGNVEGANELAKYGPNA